jgi:hypothetical protein
MDKRIIAEIIKTLYSQYKVNDTSYRIKGLTIDEIKQSIIDKMAEKNIAAGKLDINFMIYSYENDVIINF